MEKLISRTNICVYILINILFVAKYSRQFTDHYYFVSIMYLLACCIAVSLTKYIPEVFFSKKVFWLITAVFFASAVITFLVFPQEALHLRVDRYDMINLFWENFFSGLNPYTPRSAVTNIPGPFPFYFFLALPFYAVGDIGYYVLFGFAIFVFLLRKYKRNERDRIIILLCLVLSPAFLWEILCRSTIFLNTSLVLLYVLMFHPMNFDDNKLLVINAFLFGLVLSTRSVVLLILLPLLVFWNMHKIGYKKIMLWASVAGITFLATFMIGVFRAGFFSYNNPFAVQNGFLPRSIPIIFLCIMILMALKLKELKLFLFAGMLATICLVFIHYGICVKQFGFYIALFNSHADISYAILALPLCLFCMEYFPIQRQGDALGASSG